MKYIIKRDSSKYTSYLVWYNKNRTEYGWGDRKSAIEFEEDVIKEVREKIYFPVTVIPVKENI